jgi:hypothetical protein
LEFLFAKTPPFLELIFTSSFDESICGYCRSNTDSRTTLKSWNSYFFFFVLFFFAEDFALVDFGFEDFVVFLVLKAFDLDLVALAVVFFLLVVFFAADFAFELFDLLAAFLVLLAAFLLLGLAFAISILL